MNNIKIILNVVLIISVIIIIYIIGSLFYQKSMLKYNKIKEIKNKKYIALTTIIIILFIIFGVLRNFV